MAKRELIDKQVVLEVLRESDAHHAQTSRETSLLSRNRGIIERQPIITEEEIVKPYLEKARTEIKKHANWWKEHGEYPRYGAVMEIADFVDNLLTEKEENK